MKTHRAKTDRFSDVLKGFNGHHIQKIGLGFQQFFIGLIVMCLNILLPAMALAQGNSDSQIEMADAMRSNGKIYVVVLVIAIVFTGLVVFAIRTDSKLSKIERDVRNLKQPEES